MRYFLLILSLWAACASGSVAYSQVSFKIDSVAIPCTATGTFRIPVRVSNFNNVGSFQFSLGWNPAQLEYRYITRGTAPNPFFGGTSNASFDTTTFKASGRLTFAWNRVGGLSVPDTTVVFYLAVRRLGGNPAPVTFLSGANAPVQTEVTNPQADDLPFTTKNGQVKPIDNAPPVLTCPLNVIKTVSGPSIVTGIAPASVADNCSDVVVGWSSTGVTTVNQPNQPDASGTVFNPGLTTVVYRATDIAGMTATCSFTIDLQPSSTSDTLTIIAGGGSVSCGGTLGVNVTALNFDSLGSLQFSVNWNPANLRFVSFTTAGSALLGTGTINFDTLNARNTGRFSFSWTTGQLAGNTLNDGALLFRVNFTPLSGNLSGVQVNFGDIPTPREAFSNAVQPPVEVPVIFIPGQITSVDNVPPVIQCPANISITNPSGVLTANVSNTAPTTLTDNCGSPVALSFVRSGVTPGSGSGNANGIYTAGTTTVVYTATDNRNNSRTCSFTVTIDAGKPAPVSIDSILGTCTTTETIIPVRVSDFADIVGMNFSIKWDTSVLQFDTIVNVFPGMNLTSLNFQFYNSAPGGVLQFLGADPLNGWPNIPDGGVLFALKFKVRKIVPSTKIEFTGFSEAVNSALNSVPTKLTNGSFNATVDNVPPSITCPANVSVLSTTPDCKAVVKLPAAQASDACAGINTITRSTMDTLFAVGNNTVIYTASDNVGNTATCSVLVQVTGNPNGAVFTGCPANITVNAPANSCAVPVNWTAPTLNAPCGISNPQITSNFTPGNIFTKGDTTVRYRLTGSSSVCEFRVTVRDVTAPVIQCPANSTVNADAAIGCRAIATFNTPAFTDACDQNPVFTSNFVPGDTLPTGVTVIEYSVKDSGGNTGACSFSITVNNIAGPKVTCPANIIKVSAPDTCGAIVEWNLPIRGIDACAKDTVLAVTTTPSGTFFTVGETAVTYRATDANGNTGTCSFLITVSDTTKPTLIDCDVDVLIELPEGKCDTILTWTPPVAEDNCSVGFVTSDIQPGTSFGTGLHTITFTAEDDSGNTVTCAVNVIVTDAAPPTLSSCPAGIFVELPINKCDTVLTWTKPLATDACGFDTLTVNIEPGTSFKPGQQQVVYTASDLSGNTTTCSFNISVIDLVPPVFSSCPQDITVTGNGTCGAIVNWTLPEATDNCTPKPDITISSSHPTSGTFTGTTNVRILARDASGNYDTCAFRIIVNSSGVPGFQNVPDDQSYIGCSAIGNWNPPTTINFCQPPVITSTHEPGDTFAVGVTTVIYTAQDNIGNTYTASFTVTVRETQAPSVACPKVPIILNAAGAIIQDSSSFITKADTVKTCDAVRLTFVAPTATDNCGIPTLTQISGRLSGTVFPVGMDTLRFEAVDKSGNKSTCRVPITIQPLAPINIKISPLPACQGAQVVLQADTFKVGAVNYTWTGPQTNYPNASKVTIFSLNQGNSGTYSVQAEINGCITPKAFGEVQLVQKPTAEDDNMFTIDPNTTDTFDVLKNDVFFPAADINITQTGPTPAGLSYVGDGRFQYVANSNGQPASFIYELCSKTCPNLCDMATVTISVRRFECDFVPNIITPNGDQVNDFLNIPCLDSGLYPDNALVIYNQWGDKVFEAQPYVNDAANGWKGELNNEPGKDLPDGTYFYIFRPGNGQQPLKGFVDIFR
jgi:large repetitive protein